ncbi:MAG TPA: hypothetical protein VK154_13250 [Chitinophagales bacterium]|nr:hypothetical protein [Chitinophagales bacterium]
MRAILLITITIALGALVACKTKQATGTAAKANNTAETSTGTGAPAIVYKTKADYSKQVPVTLSADKSQIVAYPGIKDINYQGKPAYPFALADGYLLDNRGIGPNSAFLEITYADYAKLNSVPPLDELYKRILDRDPFTEIYNLGDRNRFTNEIEEINEIITKGGLKKFKKIK